MVNTLLIIIFVVFISAVLRGLILYSNRNKKKSPDGFKDKKIYITELGLEVLGKRSDKDATVILMPKESDILQFIRGNMSTDTEGKIIYDNGITLPELARGFEYLPSHVSVMGEMVQYFLQKNFIEIK